MVYVNVPVVPNEWTADTAVHVAATFGPMGPGEVEAWKAEAREFVEVTGQLRPVSLPKASERMRVQLGEPFVVINEGTKPQKTEMLFFLGIVVMFGGLAIHTLWVLWRARGASRGRDWRSASRVKD